MVSELKPKLNPLINLIAKPFAQIHPNILTLLGLLPPVIFLVLMLTHNYIWALISFLGLSLDMLDGAVARMSGKTSAFGGVLDSTLDRLVDAVFIYAFAICGLVSYNWVFVLLILSFLISYIRSRAELAGKAGFVLNVGWVERPERLICLFLALLGYMIYPGALVFGWNFPTLIFAILSLLSAVTVCQRILRSYQILKGK